MPVEPVLLQGAALWLLLLALLLGADDGPRASKTPRVETASGPAECPFCGALFDDYRVCWCGSDGHWF